MVTASAGARRLLPAMVEWFDQRQAAFFAWRFFLLRAHYMASTSKAAPKRKLKRSGEQSKTAARKSPPRPRSERGKLKALLAAVEERLQSDGASRVSVSDYIRLLQMKREMDEKKPRDVEVKWVDTLGEENVSDI
jgi:hypothetical protein